jgi:hypothetical protein
MAVANAGIGLADLRNERAAAVPLLPAAQRMLRLCSGSDSDQHITELPSQAAEDFVWPVLRRRGELRQS